MCVEEMNDSPTSYFRGRIITLLTALCALTAIGLGCSHSRSTTSAAAESSSKAEKVTVDAYLFDAVLVREGKTTSFRLELYAADTMVGLAGRGYLGKGALRGVMNATRLRVYFPSTNEFVDDSFAALLSDSTCSVSLRTFNPIQLLTVLPDSVPLDSQILVTRTKSSDNGLEYSVGSKCDWQLSLTYDHREVGWRLAQIKFVTSGGTSLNAARREFRPRSRVAASKFAEPVPSGAMPISR